ncbi:hypothetical protein M8J77_013841 [Diaphorina citri]|nr:hypothetical protein M8J77_013841 [Diaphorina citri]
MDGKHLPNDETPTRIEIHKAIMQMKNNKSPGMDDISAEMLKAGENCVLEMLHTLFQQIWAEKSVPAEWKDAQTPEQLQLLVDLFATESRKLGLKVNESKTEVMFVNMEPIPITINGRTLKEVQCFKYLGSNIQSYE